MTRRLVAILLAVPLLAVACSSNSAGGSATSLPTEGAPSALVADTGTLPPALAKVMNRQPFAGAHWALQVTDAKTNKTVLALHPDETMGIASVAKLFWVGAALDALGPDHTMTTPVHLVGKDLVLVASGDLAMGGRDAGRGELRYSVPPQPDANGIPGAKPAPGDPLAGLNDLARQVKAGGVSSVAGNVLIDDRLFQTWDSDSGPVTPIVVNDNLLDVLVSPGANVGDPASIRTIPETEAFTIVNEAKTVADGDPAGTSLDIKPGDGNQLVVSGTIEAGSAEVLNVYNVPDPAAYARTLFIEALRRAGVTVTADPLATPDQSALPDKSSYTDANRVASIQSPPYSQQAQLILKISHTLGARLALCLTAVQLGSTDCTDGYKAIAEHMKSAGIDPTTTWFPRTDEATTAASIVKWIGWMSDTFGTENVEQLLPTLGVDGSLGLAGTDSPAKGKIWAKTGTKGGGDLATGRLLMFDQALAGYMQGADGRVYRFGLFLSHASYQSPKDQVKALTNLADAAVAIQQSL